MLFGNLAVRNAVLYKITHSTLLLIQCGGYVEKKKTISDLIKGETKGVVILKT